MCSRRYIWSATVKGVFEDEHYKLCPIAPSHPRIAGPEAGRTDGLVMETGHYAGARPLQNGDFISK
jgi:hypothetical protein